uniref:Uncharacterized protein n=1 Tax=Arundo donax TaxID=35708 RepID=A0A0A9H8W2_ARUDO
MTHHCSSACAESNMAIDDSCLCSTRYLFARNMTSFGRLVVTYLSTITYSYTFVHYRSRDRPTTSCCFPHAIMHARNSNVHVHDCLRSPLKMATGANYLMGVDTGAKFCPRAWAWISF